MIDLTKLRDEDIGRWVEYTTPHGETERGRLKNWNGHSIFVVYKCGGEWARFKDFTGAATLPEYLNFIEMGGGE